MAEAILYVHKDLGTSEEQNSNTEFKDQIWCKVKLNNNDTLLIIRCIYTEAQIVSKITVVSTPHSNLPLTKVIPMSELWVTSTFPR